MCPRTGYALPTCLRGRRYQRTGFSGPCVALIISPPLTAHRGAQGQTWGGRWQCSRAFRARHHMPGNAPHLSPRGEPLRAATGVTVPCVSGALTPSVRPQRSRTGGADSREPGPAGIECPPMRERMAHPPRAQTLIDTLLSSQATTYLPHDVPAPSAGGVPRRAVMWILRLQDHVGTPIRGSGPQGEPWDQGPGVGRGDTPPPGD